jgi:membrane associated rhomboid family serine protease
MTDPSSVEEKHAQRDRPRLEFPVLQAFPRAVAECQAYPVTTTVIAICVVNFLLVNLVTNHAAAVVQDILVPGAVAIWAGAVWGLVTSAFVHVAWWHIVFNL